VRTPPPNIPPKIAAYLRGLIEYNWADEEADYRDHTDDPGHVFVGLQALREWLTDTPPTVPDIGDLFNYQHSQHNVVTRWLKRHPHPRPDDSAMGPDNCPLMYCTREEAEYVGVAGDRIARVADVHVHGRATWPNDLLDHHRAIAKANAGITVPRPAR
jgi:hypothetical protein